MGGCLSCHGSVPTTMLMMEDGSIEHYVSPVKVEDILRERRRVFLCDSDSLALNEYLRPLPPDYRLQLKHLYFLFPLGKLQRPMKSSDMDALMEKAGAAMKRSGDKKRSKVRSLAEDSMNGHQLHELLSQDLGQGEKSQEALIEPKRSTSVCDDKSKEGTCRQKSVWMARTPALSPILESPVNHSTESN